MPIYEYQCQECHCVFEEWQTGFEDRELECPDCCGQSKRLISHSSFHLKGSGWYADGYGGTKSGSTPGKAAEPACSGNGDSGGTDTAPAKKSESSDSSSAGSAS